VDGNKRIGFAIGVLFLQINGRKLVATEVDAVVQTLALAAGEISEAEYASWLRANSEEM
jgi:death-on-curing protein